MAKPTIDQPNWGATLNDHLDSMASDIDARETPAGAQAKADAARDAAVAQVASDVGDTGTPVGAAVDATIAANAVLRTELVANVADFGAVGDGTTDDYTALAAAISHASTTGGIVFIPRGVHRTNTALTIPNNVIIRGEGTQSQIRGAGTSTAAVILNGHDIRFENLHLSSTSGHVVEVESAYRFTFETCLFVQYVAGKSLVYQNGTGSFIDAQFLNCEFNAPTGATVSPISITNSANNIAGTRWKNLRLNGADITVPFFLIKNTGTSNWAHDHSFRDITAELCPGGIIHMESAFGVVIDGVIPWDVATYSDDIFKFTTNAISGTPTRSILVSNSGRRGGDMAVGKYDVNFGAGSSYVVAMNMIPSTTTDAYQAKINLPIGFAVAINCGSQMFRFGYAGSVKLPDPATADRQTAATAGRGAMCYDSTLGKPIWSDGTNWRDAAGVVV